MQILRPDLEPEDASDKVLLQKAEALLIENGTALARYLSKLA